MTKKPEPMSAEDLVPYREENKIFTVHFSNYYPRQIDSVWSTRALAEQRAEALDGDWRVEEMGCV